ncbi:hypothetical protein NDU88_002010 [Pleurodeles waltl]|uniref:Uncharacterized protein n=1 Tax=Pleurodeles waltl TaxID=8319 RepID=A0AAV7SDQ4_PLEWA|nr:hypothetical protein NDU88_002010 [Pleurodeles waltl]
MRGRGHGRQDGGHPLRVLWTPPSSTPKAKPYHTCSYNLRDPLWVYGCYGTRGRRAGRNPTPGGTPEGIGPGGGRGVEVAQLGAAPQGGELSRDRDLGLSESAPHEEPGAVIRAPRGGDGGPEEQCRTMSAAGGSRRRLGPGEWRTTGPEVGPHDWIEPLALVRATAGAPGRTLRGPAGPGLYLEPRKREDPGLPCPWGQQLEVGERVCRGASCAVGCCWGLGPRG